MEPEFLYPRFGGLGDAHSDIEHSHVVVLPVPYEATSSHMPGTRKGPWAIIHASRYIEWYDLELGYEPHLNGIHTMPEIHLSKDSIESALSQLEKVTAGVIHDKKFPLLLGGEHTITVGAVRAFVEAHRDLSVLYLDAHGDLREAYDGTRFSHACTARRLRELCPVVQVGTRSMSAEEAELIRSRGFRDVFRADRMRDTNIDDIISMLTDRVYLSIDLDVFDPSEMPAVGAPEPGGLHWDEITGIVRKCFQLKEVVGCDIVELSPFENSFASNFTAASLAYKLVGYKYMPKGYYDLHARA